MLRARGVRNRSTWSPTGRSTDQRTTDRGCSSISRSGSSSIVQWTGRGTRARKAGPVHARLDLQACGCHVPEEDPQSFAPGNHGVPRTELSSREGLDGSAGRGTRGRGRRTGSGGARRSNARSGSAPTGAPGRAARSPGQVPAWRGAPSRAPGPCPRTCRRRPRGSPRGGSRGRPSGSRRVVSRARSPPPRAAGPGGRAGRPVRTAGRPRARVRGAPRSGRPLRAGEPRGFVRPATRDRTGRSAR